MTDRPPGWKPPIEKLGIRSSGKWDKPTPETAKLEAEIQRLYRQFEHDPTEKRLQRIRALISRELLKLLPLAVSNAKKGHVALLRLILRYVR